MCYVDVCCVVIGLFCKWYWWCGLWCCWLVVVVRWRGFWIGWCGFMVLFELVVVDEVCYEVGVEI